jgi:glycerophosphoryl diester phosphodiesterase
VGLLIPKIIAHRGASHVAPENSRSAFVATSHYHANWVEFDIQPTKDRELVVFHDTLLDRTSNGKGPLNEQTLAALKQLDIGAWFNPQFKDERIMTLDETMALLQAHHLHFNLELKPSMGEDREALDNMLAILEKHQVNPQSVMLSSFNHATLRLLHSLTKTYPIAVLQDDWDEACIKTAIELNAVSINVNCENLNASRVAVIKAAGFGVLSYTVNDVEQASRLFDWGVDGIFTDDVSLWCDEI